jgi:hypothetical protein
MSFLIDFWPLRTRFRWNFDQKNQDGGNIKVGQKYLFTFRIYEIFYIRESIGFTPKNFAQKDMF